MFLEKNHNNKKTIEFVGLNHHNSFSDNGGYADPELGTYYGITSEQDENENWQFSYEIEYFTNSITILEDDNGYKLLTEYLSDGPVEYGFYECESDVKSIKDPAYINAWSRLEKAVANNVATEYEVEITSKATCGEMDPYFVGDACEYSAKILNENVTAENNVEVNLYFYDYDMDSLKVGQKLKVNAITISDYTRGVSDKKAFAVEL